MHEFNKRVDKLFVIMYVEQSVYDVSSDKHNMQNVNLVAASFFSTLSLLLFTLILWIVTFIAWNQRRQQLQWKFVILKTFLLAVFLNGFPLGRYSADFHFSESRLPVNFDYLAIMEKWKISNHILLQKFWRELRNTNTSEKPFI